jgi:ATP synthase protein I
MSQNGPPPEASGTGHGAWGAFGYLVAGVGMYGGLGWLGDHYLRTSFLLPVGILVGLALALYLVFKRYGHHEPKDSP